MELLNRVISINKWIEENQSTDPNMYEIMDCTVQMGEILKNCEIQTKEIEELKIEMKKMIYSRLSIKKLSSEGYIIKEDSPIIKLYDAVYYISQLCAYYVPEDVHAAVTKKELLCKLVSIAAYIMQCERDGNVYDNETEFNHLTKMYEYYKESENKQFFENMIPVYEFIASKIILK